MRFKRELCAAALALTTLSSGSFAESDKARNIILMVGDGMGPQQLSMLESYAELAPNSIYKGKDTAMTRLANAGTMGLSMTYPDGSMVVDSASSASQLATGKLSPSEAIGLDRNGDPAETILEAAKKRGKATGLISDTRLTHATPASFAAHQPHRSMENQIAEDMLKVGPDVMLSGGIRYWIPKSVNDKGESYEQVKELTGGHVRVKSKRKDNKNLLLDAQKAGYQLAFSRDEMNQAKDGKVLGLFAYSGMMDGIEYTKTKNDKERVQPTLKEMTVKALDILSQDKDGFFLMVEGGQIDWAAHNNDAATMLHEMLKFDEAVEAVYEWAADRDDTLVVVTADHETGSFGFSYSASNLPKASKLPGAGFSKRDYKPNFNFGAPQILDNLYNQTASFYGIMDKFRARPAAEQTPKALASVVAETGPFQISEKQAERILQRGPNPYLAEGHKYLSAKTLPVVKDFTAFYVYGDEIHLNLLGRELAEQQNVVWGTGTHTSTPVSVMTFGPEKLVDQFDGMQHHTDIGKKLMSAL
ncbi:alkaline phosphatase [Parendozoicomonas sp. Alg238-R29]|uniref:alkaline phosphatase n=1 Tax=Parendozoicomonas sp. Alg238-R29 TaxID=2993446 RepID=UPI00248DACF2|nr:alkaline phosphatase [Parendozoicomonas sp. Alg238-R29]